MVALLHDADLLHDLFLVRQDFVDYRRVLRGMARKGRSQLVEPLALLVLSPQLLDCLRKL